MNVESPTAPPESTPGATAPGRLSDRSSPDWERHSADVARLVVAAATTLALIGVARLFDDSIRSVSTDLIRLVRTIPDGVTFALVGLIQIIVTVAIPIGVIWLVAKRKWRVLGLAVLAAATGAAVMATLERFLANDVPETLERSRTIESWLAQNAYPTAAFLAAGAAVITAATPFIPRVWHRIATGGIVALAFLRVLTATEVPMNLLLILAVGSCMGSLALVITGAPHRRIDPESIGDALRRAGLDVAGIEPFRDDRVAPRFRVRHPSGGDSQTVLYGRDQRDQDLVLRAWRALRVKGFHARRPIPSPRRAAEHEQLMLAMAASADVRAARPVTVVSTTDDAALSVSSWVDGQALASSASENASDALLVDLWKQVDRLQTRRIVHGRLNIDSVRIEGDQAILVGFQGAAVDADDQSLQADIAELTCSLAARFGIERSVASAVQGVSPERLADALPLFQPLVLSNATRDALKAGQVSLGDVREALREAVGAESVELAPVSRVSLKGIVSLVGSIVLASYVFSLASDWRSIADAFGLMNWAAVPLLIALVLVINAGGALSMMGSVNVALPFFRTNQIMFAQGFLNRFTPANAGGMALRARYLQREGVELNVGAAAVGLTSAVSGFVQVFFIVGFLVWGGSAHQLDRFEMPSKTKLLGILVGIGIVIGAIVLSSWGRRVVVPQVKKLTGPAIASFAELARNPTKLALLFGGTTLGKLTTISAFALCVSAMGVDMSFARIGALYMVANTIGAAVPTPGGVGGIEAALTAALISAGVDAPTAGAIVLIFRLFTFWFPTLPGWACLQRAQRTGVV